MFALRLVVGLIIEILTDCVLEGVMLAVGRSRYENVCNMHFVHAHSTSTYVAHFSERISMINAYVRLRVVYMLFWTFCAGVCACAGVCVRMKIISTIIM